MNLKHQIVSFLVKHLLAAESNSPEKEVFHNHPVALPDGSTVLVFIAYNVTAAHTHAMSEAFVLVDRILSAPDDIVEFRKVTYDEVMAFNKKHPATPFDVEWLGSNKSQKETDRTVN